MLQERSPQPITLLCLAKAFMQRFRHLYCTAVSTEDSEPVQRFKAVLLGHQYSIAGRRSIRPGVILSGDGPFSIGVVFEKV